MKRFQDDLDFGDERGPVDEFEKAIVDREQDRFVIMIAIKVKAEDADIAEDAISDLLTEAIDKLGKQYQPDVKILDYCLESIEPAELD
jgi:hypothetical protein